MNFQSVVTLAVLSTLAACESAPDAKAPAAVTTERLAKADADTEDSLTHGRTHDEQRFSPLEKINAANVGRLGLAWYADLDTARGQEATPIVVEGVLLGIGRLSCAFARWPSIGVM